MALVLNTNCGFVSSAPSSDPAGTNRVAISLKSFLIRDTSPATAAKITEVGWWCDSATEEANFEVGLYDDDGTDVPGEASTRLFVSATNAKGTTAGWKKATVDWTISPSTVYWIACQLDNTSTTTYTDIATSGGSGYDLVNNQSTLANPIGATSIDDADGLIAIYAVWSAGSSSTPVPTLLTLNVG